MDVRIAIVIMNMLNNYQHHEILGYDKPDIWQIIIQGLACTIGF